MGAIDVIPQDAFDNCPECGIQFVLHEVTEHGDALHPLDGLDERFSGKICVNNDG